MVQLFKVHKIKFRFLFQEDHHGVINKETHMFIVIVHIKTVVINIVTMQITITQESQDKHKKTWPTTKSKFIKCIILLNT